MEPITVGLICTTALGVVIAMSAFIRQALLSRDKTLNDQAQRVAINQEAEELKKMREQMQSNKRFDSHYLMLGANKDDVKYFDSKIDDIFQRKIKLIERHAEISIKESNAIVDGQIPSERKIVYDKLKKEIDDELEFYSKELEVSQQKRASLWDTQSDIQKLLLNQENARNHSLDEVYQRHSGVLEKIYLRHSLDSERVALRTIDSATEAFKSLLLMPLQYLMSFFSPTAGISYNQSGIQIALRQDIRNTENLINKGQEDEVLEERDTMNELKPTP